MQRFEVIITGKGLERAMSGLNDAGIPTMGPAFTWMGPDSSDTPSVGNLMFAIVDAGTAGEATSMVSAVLAKVGGDYSIRQGVTFNPEDWKNRQSP